MPVELRPGEKKALELAVKMGWGAERIEGLSGYGIGIKLIKTFKSPTDAINFLKNLPEGG